MSKSNLGKSKLQLMLMDRWPRFNPKRGWSHGISLDWFIIKQHQGFSGSNIWGHIGEAWQIWWNTLTNFPLTLLWIFSTQTFVSLLGLNSLVMVSPIPWPISLTARIFNAEITFELVRTKISSRGLRHMLSLTSPKLRLVIGWHLWPKF